MGIKQKGSSPVCLVRIFLQNAIGLQDGVPGVVLSLHTFGDYPEKFHPHIHAIVSDGLFLKTGAFYVMPDADLKPLEEMFRAKVFTMLKEEGKIDDDIIKKLMDWRHSGFSVHNKARIARDDEKGRVALAQYIIRNTFSLEKLTYNQDAGTALCRDIKITGITCVGLPVCFIPSSHILDLYFSNCR